MLSILYEHCLRVRGAFRAKFFLNTKNTKVNYEGHKELSLRTKCGNPAVFASTAKQSTVIAIHDVKIMIMNNYYWIASSQAHRNDKWNYYKKKKIANI